MVCVPHHKRYWSRVALGDTSWRLLKSTCIELLAVLHMSASNRNTERDSRCSFSQPYHSSWYKAFSIDVDLITVHRYFSCQLFYVKGRIIFIETWYTLDIFVGIKTLFFIAFMSFYRRRSHNLSREPFKSEEKPKIVASRKRSVQNKKGSIFFLLPLWKLNWRVPNVRAETNQSQ